MQIREVMTQSVESIAADASIRSAAEKMKSLDVGVLPVLEGDKAAGILTDRDVTIRGVAEGKNPESTPCREIMTTGIETISQEEDVREGARLMEDKQIRRLLVLDGSNNIAGIVSLGDLAVETRERNLSGEVLEKVSEPSKPAR